ncbi:hypothetical protein GMMP15_1900014 [Candidatus Magnetomoraceae bacterium gMMP-15]
MKPVLTGTLVALNMSSNYLSTKTRIETQIWQSDYIKIKKGSNYLSTKTRIETFIFFKSKLYFFWF